MGHLLEEADQCPTPPCSVLGTSPITTHRTIIELAKKATMHLFFLGSLGWTLEKASLGRGGPTPPAQPTIYHSPSHNRADERLSVYWRRTEAVSLTRSTRKCGIDQLFAGGGVQAVQLPKHGRWPTQSHSHSQHSSASSASVSHTKQKCIKTLSACCSAGGHLLAVAGPSLPR